MRGTSGPAFALKSEYELIDMLKAGVRDRPCRPAAVGQVNVEMGQGNQEKDEALSLSYEQGRTVCPF